MSRNGHEEQLAVVSWNILAPSYDRYGLDWQGARLPSLRGWFDRLAEECDVLCVQELDVERGVNEEMRRALGRRGFEGVVQERRGFPVVNATFYKASRLKLAWVEHRSRALLCGLVLPDGRELCVVNVHLEAGNGVDNEAQRASQLTSALRRLRARASASWSQVVCGDFNDDVGPRSKLCAALSEAGLSRAPLAGPTFAGEGHLATFDHIFAGRGMRFDGGVRSCVEAMRGADEAYLPSEAVPSDHLPVSAVYRIAAGGSAGGPALPIVEPPSTVGEALRREWVEILLLAPAVGQASKTRLREQRQLEKDYLGTLAATEASELKAWQAAASDAAKAVLQAAVGRAMQRVDAAADGAASGEADGAGVVAGGAAPQPPWGGG